MMEAHKRSMLAHIDDKIAALPRGDPRRQKLKLIRYGFAYDCGLPALNKAIKNRTKPAVCSKCGRDLNRRVPLDAEEVTCFSCDNREAADKTLEAKRFPPSTKPSWPCEKD